TANTLACGAKRAARASATSVRNRAPSTGAAISSAATISSATARPAMPALPADSTGNWSAGTAENERTKPATRVRWALVTTSSVMNSTLVNRAYTAFWLPLTGSSCDAMAMPLDASIIEPAISKTLKNRPVIQPRPRPISTCPSATPANAIGSVGGATLVASGARKSDSPIAMASRAVPAMPFDENSGAVITHALVRASTRRKTATTERSIVTATVSPGDEAGDAVEEFAREGAQLLEHPAAADDD